MTFIVLNLVKIILNHMALLFSIYHNIAKFGTKSMTNIAQLWP